MDILIIGLGVISAKHIKALKLLSPDVNIYALRTTSFDEVEGVTNIRALSDLKVNLTFAIISNPTNLHLDTISEVSELNIPLFIEKPPSHTTKGAEKVIEQIKAKNITTYVACNLRFHPCIQFLKTYLQNNHSNLNEVNVYCGSYLPDWRPGRDYRTFYSANVDQGGGVHLDLFHEMDYAIWLFGKPLKSYGFWSNKSSLQIAAADYGNYLLSYADFNLSVILNYYRRTPKRTIEIVFDEDTWTIDLINNKIIADKNQLIFEAPQFVIFDSYIDQMKYYLECLEKKLQPMNSFESSIEVLQFTLDNVSTNQ